MDLLIYRDHAVATETVAAIGDLRRRAETVRDGVVPADAVTDWLADLGEVCAGLLDAILSRRDDSTPSALALEAALLAAAAAWGTRCAGAVASVPLGTALDRLMRVPLPPRFARRPAEGYAYYAVHPATYVEAARAWIEANGRPDEPVLCVGIRGIGASLGAVVAAEIARHGVPVSFCTVRPRGHPFDRHVTLGDGRAADWRQQSTFATALVVDEGPGLSGSSFVSVADALRAAGFPDARIWFVPSWSPDPATFVSDRARAGWPRHPRCVADFDRTMIAGGRLGARWGAAGLRDIAAGKWRDLPGAATHAAAHPWHERRKYLEEGRSATAQRVQLIAYAGLGVHGVSNEARADALADGGWSPRVEPRRLGFLRRGWIPAAPASVERLDVATMRQIADYTVWRARALAATRAAEPERLLEMTRHNVRRAVGDTALAHVDACFARCPRDRREVHADARMQPHEWLIAGDRLIKVDATDHGDGHFYPGPCDIAWDVAGAIEEWRLRPAASDALVGAHAHAGDRSLPTALPFHQVAYVAFAWAYAHAASEQLAGTTDGARFAERSGHLRNRLRRLTTGST